VDESKPLAPGTREMALRAFTLLAQGESSVHGVPVDQVHFHEVVLHTWCSPRHRHTCRPFIAIPVELGCAGEGGIKLA